MVYVRKSKWHPISDPVREKRRPTEHIRNMQRALTMAYINCNSKWDPVRKKGEEDRERISAELIRQAGLPIR